jgi:hypothetical protein
MLEFDVHIPDLNGLVSWIGEVRASLTQMDLTPLAPTITKIVVEGNRRDRLAGIDKNGRRLDPVKDPNPARRGGSGPPLAPNSGSRSIILFGVGDVRAAPNGLDLTVGWQGADWLAAHAKGKGRYGPIPVRDILDLTAQTREAIGDALDEFVRQKVERVMGGLRLD